VQLSETLALRISKVRNLVFAHEHIAPRPIWSCPSSSIQNSMPLLDLNGAAYDSKPRSNPNMLGAMVASGLFGKEIKSNPEIHDIIRSRDRPILLRGEDHDMNVAPANSNRDTADYFQYGSASSHLHVAAAEGHVNSVSCRHLRLTLLFVRWFSCDVGLLRRCGFSPRPLGMTWMPWTLSATPHSTSQSSAGTLMQRQR
jgi:hypothetical protein